LSVSDQEIALKSPRFRIAWLMAGVALIAIDFGAVRGLSNIFRGYGANEADDFLIMGGLPMTNVLAVGLLVGRQRLRSRCFLLGFEVFGATALASFVFVAGLFGRDWLEPYLLPVLLPLEMGLRGLAWSAQAIILCSAAAILLTLPQIAYALLGGVVSRRLRTRNADQ
jgi:hypothetical protein